MRDQKRSFVVEYKSRTRASKIAKPVSIWGDTDLRTIARQVEQESSHPPTLLGKPAIEVAPPVQELRPSIASSVLLETMPIGAPENEAEPATVTVQILPHVGPSAQLSILDETPKHTSFLPRRKPRRAPPEQAASRPLAAIPSTYEVTPAEIADLLDENARLKALLRVRLHADNQRLKVMLARFSS